MYSATLDIAAKAELELRRRKRERERAEAKKREHYAKHPLDYFHDRLKIPKEKIDWSLIPEYKAHTWDGTPNPFVRILDALVNWRWVGVESATGVGKTFIGAAIVLWFLDTFENSLVVTTAPKQDQLSLHIWKEIGKRYEIFGKGELTSSLELRMRPGRKDWIAVGFVAGVKADEDSATKAQGFHAEHMLIILEETPGIPEPIITAFQNTSTAPHNLILAFGNPDHQLDTLHKFCMQEEVEHIRISAYDHPNVVLKDPTFIPGAASEKGIKRIISKFGKNNPLTLSRTRGISPKQSSDSLIKVDWCIAATEKFKAYLDEDGTFDLAKVEGEKGLGVDVANSVDGDKAAICKGKGNVCYSVEDFQCEDSNQLGHRIALMMKTENISSDRVGVDGVGVGAGTINALKEDGIPKYKEIDLQGSAKPVENDKAESFNTLRSQMWWQAREDLRNGEIAMVNDIELITDLTTPKFEIRNGKIVVESKEDLKKRLGRSPNKGDAFVYWNWRRVPRGRTKKIKAMKSIY